MSSSDERPVAGGTDARTDTEARARKQAVKQIERRRRFHGELFVGSVGMAILVVIWATSEYHNAGGWPSDGFSQSSSIPNVWNIWIIYPLLAWVLYICARAWSVYRRRPISEDEIRRELERQSRGR